MNALLRALLLRNRYLAPAGSDGELPGGAVAELDEEGGDDDGAATAGQGEGGEDEEGGEVVVSLGEDGDDDADDDAIAQALGDNTPTNARFARMRVETKDLRRQTRDQAETIRKLQAQLAQAKPAEQPVVVGPEPKIEDFDYDGERFATEYKAWIAKKAEADAQQRQREEAEQAQMRQWQSRIDAVTAAANDGFARNKDYGDALQTFEALFSPVQQGIIIGGPDDAKRSAALRYALGRNPAKARELAAITDPVKFTFAVAKLESQMKFGKPTKNTPPAPDRPLRSNVSGAAAIDDQLERLRAEAAKTGDMTKVVAYKKQLKAKQAA